MVRKINYKEVSEEYNKMGAPRENSSARFGRGVDQGVGEYYYINQEDLIPFQNQARKIFDPKEIQALADSIKLYGIRQPLTIISSKIEKDKYEVISGERRLKAARLAEISKIPCIILQKNYDPEAIALVENVHRKDLHPLELMNAYQSVLDKGIFSSIAELSNKTGIPRSSISEIVNLNNLPLLTQNLLLEKQLKSRSLLRDLMKAPSKEHGEIIRIFESGKEKTIFRKKKVFEPKIKVLNIVHQANNFSIENNRLEELTEQQKEEMKKILVNIIEKI